MRRNVRTKLGGCLAVLGTLGVVGTALAHEFDHPAPSFSEGAPLSSGVNAGGDNAEWELIATFPTGNPHTDLDFFTQGGETFASVGTLAAGANGAGQTIIKLVNADGEVAPGYVSGHPSATCPGAASGVTGLQHDSEAAPKGNALLQQPNKFVDTRDTQLVIDTTDAPGRCHDQGMALGVTGAPRGGLEIIDVTDSVHPVEIGLTSHVGQAHTVNVDPKRPHIAYVSSSDFVTADEEGTRETETEGNVELDGIEVVDLSSCMNFLPDTPTAMKREKCDPVVYRYRYPTLEMARSHTHPNALAACHELEIYPDDKLTCASGPSTIYFDMKETFDDNGTPTDFTDDKPRGTPLPCSRRASSTPAQAPWTTGAIVEDCVNGVKDGAVAPNSLRVKEWLDSGAPSLDGVEHIGTFHHDGFVGTTENQAGESVDPTYDSKTDMYFSHEAELTQSGRYIFASDERGGGVLPGGASCTPGADNTTGNGGLHFFHVDEIGTPVPATTDEEAVEAYRKQIYATDSEGNRAIFRAPIRTEPQGSLCTAHVFQQIPGQNRIFMGWYSQGTQVVDFTENADGTVDFKLAGYFVPENANEWTSHVFKVQQNQDGSFTYWGAAGDFALGDAGRNAIEVWKVTLPAPPKPRFTGGQVPPGNTGPPTAEGEPEGTPTFPISDARGVEKGAEPPACASASGFDFIRAKPRSNRKRVRFSFGASNRVDATIFRQATGRRIARRRVKTFRNRNRAFTWAPRRARNGYYDVRLRTEAPNGRTDTQHVSLRRKRGRFFLLPYFDRRSTCALLKYSSLGRSVFGGRRRVPLRIRFNLAQDATVAIEVRHRSGKVVRRFKAKSYERGKTTKRVRLGRRAKRGAYRVTFKADRPGRAAQVTLRSRKL
jgi:hypothetical protein